MLANIQKPQVYSRAMVRSNKKIAEGIYHLVLSGNYLALPDQFFMLKLPGLDPLLPRPLSVYKVDHENISFLYQVVGKGTEQLADLVPGNILQITGPLGNGFDPHKILSPGIKSLAVVAGGIGTAPMPYTIEYFSAWARNHGRPLYIDFYAGFRREPFALEGLQSVCRAVYVSAEKKPETWQGDLHLGYITEIFKPEIYQGILTCGPEIMMDKVVSMARTKGVPVWLSMEKRMACGFGVCLGCVCSTTTGNRRSCTDGPVFKDDELVLARPEAAR